MKLIDKCFSIIGSKEFSKKEEIERETFNTLMALTAQYIYTHILRIFNYVFVMDKFKLVQQIPRITLVMDDCNAQHIKFKSDILNKEIDIYIENAYVKEYYPVPTYLYGIYSPGLFKVLAYGSNVDSIFDYGELGNNKIYDVLKELEEHLKNVKYANYDI